MASINSLSALSRSMLLPFFVNLIQPYPSKEIASPYRSFLYCISFSFDHKILKLISTPVVSCKSYYTWIHFSCKETCILGYSVLSLQHKWNSNSSGSGVIPNRRYSPRPVVSYTVQQLIWWDSRTDSKVWMREGLCSIIWMIIDPGIWCRVFYLHSLRTFREEFFLL